jgi:hypothetical protein
MNKARSTQRKCGRHTRLQDVELMPQYQDLGRQLLSRLEVVAQHADEQETDCNHSAIMF